MPAQVPSSTQVAEAIAEHLDGVFAEVLTLRDELASLVAQAPLQSLRTADLGGIRLGLQRRLTGQLGLVRGMGVVTVPGLFVDQPRWIEWWRWEHDRPEQTEFQLDPESLDYYDYTRADWFLIPHRADHRSIVGPYVDFWGVNHYILTLTTPVLVGRRFVGVAGADLRVDEVERRLYRALRGMDGDLVLVNEANRVVGSKSARWLAGSVLRGHAVRERVPVPGWPWQLVRLG